MFSKINWLLASFILSIALSSCSAKDDSGSLIISMPDSSAARSLSSSGSLGDGYPGGEDTTVYTVAVRDRDNKDVEVFKNVKPGSLLTITELMPGTYNVAIRMIMTGSDDVIYYGATEAVVKGGTENAAHITMASASPYQHCRINFPNEDSTTIGSMNIVFTCKNGDNYYVSGGSVDDDDDGGSFYETSDYFFEPGFTYTASISIYFDGDWSGPFKRTAKASKNGIVFD